MRCVSEGAEHGGVKFPGVAVLTKFLLDGAGLPILLSTVELLFKFLGCAVILEVAECLFVDKRDCAMQTTLAFLAYQPNRRAVDDEVGNDASKFSLVFTISLNPAQKVGDDVCAKRRSSVHSTLVRNLRGPEGCRLQSARAACGVEVFPALSLVPAMEEA